MTAIDPTLSGQLAYYDARADEYDRWWLRQGRYDRGPAETARWFREAAQLDAALEAFQPRGDVLELACGTGLRSGPLLATADRLTVVDGSGAMLARHASRFGPAPVDRIQANLFTWTPPRPFDVVCFGFWLSHVPPERFEEFWGLVRRALKPRGRFFFVDSRRAPHSTAVDHVLPGENEVTMTRRLDDGREFQVYKVFYGAAELAGRLEQLGWDCTLRETETYFIQGEGSPRLP